MDGYNVENHITQDEFGIYHWTGTIDRGYEDKTFKITFSVCGGICALLILMSLFIGGEVSGIVLLSSLGVMAVCGGVCWLFNRNAGNRKQSYIMNEEYVGFHQRRYYAPITFNSVRKAVIYESRNMIELFQAIGSGPVFVPPEDFPFVKEFIIQRLPQTADIECRN